MNFSPRETLDGGGKGEKEKGFLKGILRVIGGGREGRGEQGEGFYFGFKLSRFSSSENGLGRAEFCQRRFVG